MTASGLTKREISPLQTLTVVVVAAIAITVRLACTNIIRKQAGGEMAADPPQLGLIGKSVPQDLQK